MKVDEYKCYNEYNEGFLFDDGSACLVTRHGWLVDMAGKSIPHPMVDEMMEAIVLFDRERIS